MPPKKRGLAEAQSRSRRRSTRLSSVKSSYFEGQDDLDDYASPPPKSTKTAANASRSRRRPQNDVSDDEDQYEERDLDDEDNGHSDVSDKDDSATPPPKSGTGKRGRGRPPNNSGVRPQTGKSKLVNIVKSGSGAKKRGRPADMAQASPSARRGGHDDDEDKNDESEDDDASDEPKVTFIPLPELRDTNGVEYEDTKVHPNTLLFLGDLKANNKRSWLKSKFG